MVHLLISTRLFSLVALFAVGAIAPSLAQVIPNAGTSGGEGYQTGLATELIGLFVVATIMESALATLFNWRLYREFFDNKAMKTVIMVAFGYLVVTAFNYDIFYKIVAGAGGSGGPGPGSKLLSALVLAGGSAAVYQLFRSLGLRPPAEPVAPPQPDESKAWVSVTVVREKAVGDIAVHFEKVASPTPEAAAVPPLAGTLADKQDVLKRAISLFLADPMRFPRYGGRTVEAGHVYRISISGARRAANVNDKLVPFTDETVYVGRFAGRAVVDLVHTI